MFFERPEVICLAALLGSAAIAATLRAEDAPERVRVYVGTYTGGESRGIYRFELDLQSGAATEPELAAEVTNPSFLAIHANGRYLYSVSEISDLNGKKTGGVAAFAIEPPSGDLKLLNQQPSMGAGPCHLVVSPTGSHVLVANYGGGSVAALPIGGDGRLGEATAAVQHEGSSVDPRRQQGPHAHSINLDKTGRFACAADLGLDKVLIYRFHPQRGSLEPNDPPFAKVAAGAGPRHFAFHPGGKYAYVINEMQSTVTAFAWDADRGALTELQTISTLPEGFDGNNSTAEVLVHPSGRFLYGSNRGHDSIAIFTIDPQSGRLTHIGNEPTQGETPRNFGIDPTGRWLLAENQASDTIVIFAIDSESGKLEATGNVVHVPSPVCVKMLPIGG